MNLLWFLEGIRTPAGNDFFNSLPVLGRRPFAFRTLLFYWCYDKKFARRIGLTYFSSGLVVQNLKIIFRIPRPWILDPDFHPVQSAIPHATGYSFPSGHTQGATSLFASLALGSKQRSTKFLFTASFLLVGFSPDVSWRPYSKGCADFPCDLPWVLCGVLPVCRYSVSEDPYFVCRTGGDFLFRTCLSLSSSEI